jgi:transposase
LKTLLPQDPVKRGKGMPHANFCSVLNTIFWILHTGARWKDVPKDPNFASKSTAHRWLQRWKKEGVFDQMLIHLLRQSQEEELTDCQRLMVDGSFSPCEDGR